MNNFSNILTQLRKSQKLSQAKLGEQLGVSQREISFYETGKRYPDFQGFLKLADFFGVSMDYLAGRTDDPKVHQLDSGA